MTMSVLAAGLWAAPSASVEPLSCPQNVRTVDRNTRCGTRRREPDHLVSGGLPARQACPARPHNPPVAGSSPARPTNYLCAFG